MIRVLAGLVATAAVAVGVLLVAEPDEAIRSSQQQVQLTAAQGHYSPPAPKRPKTAKYPKKHPVRSPFGR